MTSYCQTLTRALGATITGGAALLAGSAALVKNGIYRLPEATTETIPAVTEKVCTLWYFCKDVVVQEASQKIIPYSDTALDSWIRFGATAAEGIVKAAPAVAIAIGTILAVRAINNYKTN